MSNIAAADELSQIRRAATGDHAAFALLVRRYEARILTYLRQAVGDTDLASDLAQETFLAAYQALPRWQPPPPDAASRTTDLLSPWLYRIATNHAISTLRRQTMSARRTPVSATRASFSLEDAVIGRELLRAALATLEADDAACLVLLFSRISSRGQTNRPTPTVTPAITPTVQFPGNWGDVVPPQATILDVAVVSQDDIWAAGLTGTDHGIETLLMHYDGARWQVSPDTFDGA